MEQIEISVFVSILVGILICLVVYAAIGLAIWLLRGDTERKRRHQRVCSVIGCGGTEFFKDDIDGHGSYHHCKKCGKPAFEFF